MTFTAFRGEPFREEFTFKNAAGKVIPAPMGNYRVILERGEFVKVFANLRITRNTIFWTMTADETDALQFSTMYFTLTHEGNEVARGVLRVN